MISTAVEISDTLKFLLDTFQISEAELGRKINIPRATINRLASGKTPDPRASTLKAIANFFNVSVDQLLGKAPILTLNDSPTSNKAKHSIPIIGWNVVHNWKHTVENIKPNNHFSWVISDPKINGGDFALEVQGDAMWPQFETDTILIVCTSKPCKNRDYVIAYIKDKNEALFRQILVEGGIKLLRATNDIFPTIQLKNADEIIGVVVQSRNSYS